MRDQDIREALGMAIDEVYGTVAPDIRAGMARAYLSEAGIAAPITEHTAPVAPGGTDWAGLTPEDLTARIGRAG